jgi:UDP:flavonoid glycosyltransferase YjiC (YdhE family)
MSRYLLTPCNNTLSHIAKSLALRHALEARGHEVFLAVSARRTAFLDRIGEGRYVILPDIQEADAAPLPGFSWFRPERFEACVHAEVELLRTLRPDAVLGVFRFTGPVSAALAGVPYDSLICGAMTPACAEVLGFAKNEPGEQEQARALSFFRETCAQRLRPALTRLGLPAIEDIWQLLEGKRTFLWDTPEFQPLPEQPTYCHVGQVLWNNWPHHDVDLQKLDTLGGPIAYVAFGTGSVPAGWLPHLVEALWHIGCSVALGLGGQQAPDELPVDPARLAVFDFLPVEQVLPRAALVVCHGGQGLIFEALRQHTPVFVLPMQPEQAQNGVCLERIGCGHRLLRGVVFGGHATDIDAAFLARPTQQLAEEISAFLANGGLAERLDSAARHLSRYRGAEQLVSQLEKS